MPKPASRDCFAGMHVYVKKASEESTEYKDATKDTVKCSLVKGKLDTEVITMCVVPVWVGRRNGQDVRYARQLQSRFIH